MNIRCPNCGKTVAVKGLGRKPLNIPLKNICDAIKTYRSVAGAAQELCCSPAYIFGMLKANGMKPKDIIQNKS